MENQNIISVFTDGSSLGNPGPGGWGAIVIFDGKVKELGGGEKPTTNNRMELSATIGALTFIGKSDKKIVLHTDSQYVINGITKWIWGWQKNKWKTSDKTEVANRDLWEKLLQVTGATSSEDSGEPKKNIEWKHVDGHVNVAGNERADRIAVSIAEGKPEKLFDGNFSEYGIQNILDLSYDIEQKKNRIKKKSYSKVQAYSYVSLVDGKIMTHQTWAECEARVRGKKAKYKKSTSKEDEGKIIKEWI
ncbi:MAG: ribonuclease HI [Candidatus Parcubacteria bacterium]|nr:ribonuclease HI [Candidatus Parcubacteria bacterium]